MACVPDESIFTVEEYKASYKSYIGGIKEVQYADKRVVYRSIDELARALQLMYNAIWGHCQPNGIGTRRIAVSSKGLC